MPSWLLDEHTWPAFACGLLVGSWLHVGVMVWVWSYRLPTKREETPPLMIMTSLDKYGRD